jgi:hypothetical protein
MSYTDLGFNEFLTRDFAPSAQQQNSQELDPLQFDSFTQQISASKLQGGVMLSPDGKIALDLDQGFFRVSNGLEELVRLGTLPDGTVGLLIKDSQGNQLLQISEGSNIIQSSGKTMTIDLINEQLLIRDAQGNIRVLIGKDPGGF